jgi:DNA-directed RNA polymerase subunit N (RpoN/RPB10)
MKWGLKRYYAKIDLCGFNYGAIIANSGFSRFCCQRRFLNVLLRKECN